MTEMEKKMNIRQKYIDEINRRNNQPAGHETTDYEILLSGDLFCKPDFRLWPIEDKEGEK